MMISKGQLLEWAEQRKLPDAVVRTGIRRLLRKRLAEEAAKGGDMSIDAQVAALRDSPVAVETAAANAQHYEVPSAYFREVLGPHLKYSCGYWPEGVDSLEASEAAMLQLTCERAALEDGQRILELGCGWGSLSLWMAAQYPKARITALSNSNSQRQYIEACAGARGLQNLEVITGDINAFEAGATFDRVVSVEMFEHMKNYAALMQRIHAWLKPGGKLFVHIFVHDRYCYPFETSADPEDWMANYFFTGGTMPSDDLLLYFQDHLKIEAKWRVNGCHYSKTLEAWLALQDARETAVRQIFTDAYGADRAALWIQRWRMFYMACSELFRFQGGEAWYVSHYRFAKAQSLPSE